MPTRFPCSETSYHGPSMAGISQPCLRSGTRSNANALSKLHGMLLTASAVEADGLSCSLADNAIAADDVENRPIDADS